MQSGAWDSNRKARSISTWQCCLLGPGDACSLELFVMDTPLMGSAYPSKFLVLQGKDSCALCEQLHLHSRQRMCRGEVTLCAPAVDRIREVSVETSALTMLNSIAFFLSWANAGLTRGSVECHILLSSPPKLPE